MSPIVFAACPKLFATMLKPKLTLLPTKAPASDPKLAPISPPKSCLVLEL
ncbi:hypothetical protein [Iningainema tapete]|uniref:Uncharacterized protein n=1 Tax=Iningainema tapete BLCC-T55 TaxID=2748662 RepID=A0A8J7BZ21_9CYAN|nr:hypothetical protein [Iningainema tapete]MBD2775008.1 hypothetical protein [Iningainema tapete BLCC-T55]